MNDFIDEELDNEYHENDEEAIESGFIYHESFFSGFRKTALYVYLKSVILSVLFVCLFVHFIQVSTVSGHSMDTTLHNGQIVLVNKHLYRKFNYGDIVIAKIKMGNSNEQIIKRVIGKPGDVIQCNNGVMYRNGKKLYEPYIKEKMGKATWGIKVTDDKLFLMGDNRNNSADSRVFGSIKYSNIVGKVFIFLP